MAEFDLHQSSFGSGVLNPKGFGITNLPAYGQMAQLIENFYINELGGLERRACTQFVADETATVADDSTIKVYVYSATTADDYVLVFKPLSVEIYYDDALEVRLPTPHDADDIPNLRVAAIQNSIIVVDGRNKIYELNGNGPHPQSFTYTVWNFIYPPQWGYDETYADDTNKFDITTGPNLITITAGSFVFSADFVEGRYLDTQGNLVRLTKFNSPTVMEYENIGDAAIVTGVNPGKNIVLTEPAFSDKRGWPETVAAFQSRLVFGGCTDNPVIVALSQANAFKDFSDYRGGPGDGITRSVNAQGGNKIIHMDANESLFVFTNSGVFASPLLVDAPADPGTFQLVEQCKDGISEAVPAIYDNQVLYADYGGTTIRGLTYQVQGGAYQVSNMSRFSSHLIRTPVSMCAYRNPDVSDATYVFVVNVDGTIAVYEGDEQMNISGWTLSTFPNGHVVDIASAGNKVYCIVRRVISGSTKYYLEKFNFSEFLDSLHDIIFTSPTNTLTGLGALNGETVGVLGQINGNEYYLGEYTVNGSVITLDVDVEAAKVGYNFNSQLQMLRPSLGNRIPFVPMHVQALYVAYYETLGLQVNGYPVPDLRVDTTVVEAPLVLKSGVYRTSPVTGYGNADESIISIGVPFPCTLSSIGRRIGVN